VVFVWQPQKEKLLVLGVRQVVVIWYCDMNYELDNDSANTPTIMNQPCDKTLCQSAYGTDPVLAPYCYLN
jgi:hypothetical protein